MSAVAVGELYRPTDEEEIGLIQGKRPASKHEWFVALALWELGWPFEYQVPLRGGRIAGGQVLDFLVATVPRPTPLQPFSVYFHRGQFGVEDNWKLAVVRQIYGVEPVVWWSDEIDTRAKAYQKALDTFGPGPLR